jgi:hypothetical protein
MAANTAAEWHLSVIAAVRGSSAVPLVIVVMLRCAVGFALALCLLLLAIGACCADGSVRIGPAWRLDTCQKTWHAGKQTSCSAAKLQRALAALQSLTCMRRSEGRNVDYMLATHCDSSG